MTHELIQPMSEPLQESSPISSDVISPRFSKSNKKLWILSGIAIVIICCFSVVCLAVIEPLVFNVLMTGMENIPPNMETEKAPIESVLDSYMKYMVAKDAESAYALFSPRAQRQIKILKIQEMFDNNNYVLFEGYQGLTVYSVSIGAHVNINPDAPQGIIASATGIITYQNSVKRTFRCTLEKVNEKWQIYDVYITLAPNTTK